MSYDISLTDPVSGHTVELDSPHHMRGGTYAVGGTTYAELNVTYNYGEVFRRLFGEKGIRSIYGLTGAASIPVLESAASQLSDEVDEDYWQPAEGNVKRALLQLLALARLRPDAVWDGD